MDECRAFEDGQVNNKQFIERYDNRKSYFEV